MIGAAYEEIKKRILDRDVELVGKNGEGNRTTEKGHITCIEGTTYNDRQGRNHVSRGSGLCFTQDITGNKNRN